MKYGDWQDIGNFFHIQKFPTVDGSENGPLFTAEVCLFSRLNSFAVKIPRVNNLKISNFVFRDRYGGMPKRFSHDNMTGLYCLKELGFNGDMELPVVRWDSVEGDKYRKYWLHPRDVIFYASLKYEKLSFLLPLLYIFAIVSFLSPRDRTSGKCLWFTRFGTLSWSKNKWKRFIGKTGLKLAEIMLRPAHGKNPYIDVFEIYFKNEGHPCREEIKVYYENLK